MEKLLNWKAKQNYAKRLSISELNYAIKDCIECIASGIDSGYYLDEISVYRQELSKRGI